MRTMGTIVDGVFHTPFSTASAWFSSFQGTDYPSPTFWQALGRLFFADVGLSTTIFFPPYA